MRIIEITRMLNKKNEPVEVAQGSGIFVKLPNMQGMERALLARILKTA